MKTKTKTKKRREMCLLTRIIRRRIEQSRKRRSRRRRVRRRDRPRSRGRELSPRIPAAPTQPTIEPRKRSDYACPREVLGVSNS
jgi:hypothetical protein